MKNHILSLTLIISSLVLTGCADDSNFVEEVTLENNVKKEKIVSSISTTEKKLLANTTASFQGVLNQGMKSSVYHYPKYAVGKLPVVIILHGYFSKKERMEWIAEQLAQRGFIAIAITGKNNTNMFTNPKEWIPNYKAGFVNIKAENNREASPLYNKFDLNRVSLVGHSMGGGGGFYFADQTSEKIKSMVMMAPYSLTRIKPGANTRVPAMIIAGGRDGLATKSMTTDIYNTLASRTKEYVFFKKAAHTDFEIDIKKYPKISSKLFGWLERYGK